MEISSYLANPLFDKILKSGASIAARKFLKRDPVAAQEKIFSQLLVRGSKARFGMDYGFPELTRLPFAQAYHLYRERVPIRTYDDFRKDYLAKAGRCRKGDGNCC
ncbi:GH3 family domain-containing protein [Geotalea toluenoxydans]|uniref:GH3 family domain-containing protein n=1 Tax=Geotalea toluenoxydans TaxID=421624 RepID=UPI000A422EB3|nr:GH3 auxin-responsive promoter family protein [Geotalea toluenoxydans]